MPTALVLALAILISGCSLDRAGIGAATGRDATTDVDPDAGAPADDGGPVEDGGPVDGDRDAFVEGDDAGRCGTGDADGDGTPDGCDVCPGSDDRVDGDADGMPDGCDTWPCGAVVPTIPTSVSAEEITISAVSIDGRNTAVVRAGTDVDIELHYVIDDDSCPGCIDQIEIGMAPGNRHACVYDGNPGGGGVEDTLTVTLRAPPEPGLRELRFNLGQRYACTDEGATTWWLDPPGPDQTFGALCVVP
jgi:hypothetical protein